MDIWMENLESTSRTIKVMVPRLRCSSQALNCRLYRSLWPQILKLKSVLFEMIFGIGFLGGWALVGIWSSKFVIQWFWLNSCHRSLLFSSDVNIPFGQEIISNEWKPLYPWAKKLFCREMLKKWSRCWKCWPFSWWALHYFS